MELMHGSADAPRRQPPPGVVTYYRNGGVCVTNRWLVVRGGHRYATGELCDPRTVRAPRDPITVNAGIAAGTVAVGITFAAGYLDTAGWVGAGAVLAAPLTLAAYGLLRRPRMYELWASYRGMTVQLLVLDDRERFGQICRAVLRALESQPDC